jgi:uncharacterized protein YegP (UPF0339 family)
VATGYAYYVIEPRSGGYRALFFGGNDELVWWSEVYTTKSGAESAIEFNRKYANIAPVVDRT